MGEQTFLIKTKESSLILFPKNISSKTDAQVVIGETEYTSNQIPSLHKSLWLPGEYEVKGVSSVIKRNDKYSSVVIEIDGFRFLYLPKTSEVDEKYLEELDDINVLMVGVSEPKTAVKVSRLVAPNYIIPMAAGEELSNFFTEFGASASEVLPKLVIKSNSVIIDEMKLVALASK